MPAIDPQLLAEAVGGGQSGQPQTLAEKSQAAMLWPIYRYKSAVGRAATPQIEQALRRQ